MNPNRKRSEQAGEEELSNPQELRGRLEEVHVLWKNRATTLGGWQLLAWKWSLNFIHNFGYSQKFQNT